MSNLPSVKQKIQTESTRYLSAVSEFLVQTVGKSINWLIDEVDQLNLDISNLFLGQSFHGVTHVSSGIPFSFTCPAGFYFSGTLVMGGPGIGTSSETYTINTTGYASTYGPVLKAVAPDPQPAVFITGTPGTSEFYSQIVITQFKLAPGQTFSVTTSVAALTTRMAITGQYLTDPN